MKKIYCIQGYTSSGKDSILKKVSKELEIYKLVSTTTRPKREGEEEGVDYYYKEDITKEGQVSYREYTTVEGVWKYGLSKEELEKEEEGLVILDVEGAKELKRQEGVRVVTIYIKVSEEKLRERQKQRGDSQKEFERRLRDDKQRFKGYKADYVVENEGELEEAVYKVKRIIERERLSERVEEEIKETIREIFEREVYREMLELIEECKKEGTRLTKGEELIYASREDRDLYKEIVGVLTSTLYKIPKEEMRLRVIEDIEWSLDIENVLKAIETAL